MHAPRKHKQDQGKRAARAQERQDDMCAFLAQPAGSWINEVPEAPAFYPSAEEWADPAVYIRSIQAAFKGAGLCRIVPPVMPAVPGPLVLSQRPGWRYTVRQQFLGGAPWKTFDDAHTQIWESHKTYTLQEHEKAANSYATKTFGTTAHMPARMVEAEYWRQHQHQRTNAAALDPGTMSPVLYGNDVEGSAFSPRGDDPLAASPWNPGTLPTARGSLLRWVNGAVIPGVTSPMLYIGMLGATFCFHVEDHYLYSINYHHWGAPKVWYGVPASGADAFEDAVASSVYSDAVEAARREGASDADIRGRVVSSLLLKSTMVSPGILLQKGVPVFRAVQQPGEYVVTLPRSYHGGFSCGFNCGEAVNFATADWLPFALQCAARLRRLRLDHILPTEQILVMEATRAVAASLLKSSIGRGGGRPSGGSGGGGGGAASAAEDGECEGGAAGPSKGAASQQGGVGAPLPPTLTRTAGGSDLVTLRCFVRLMRWLNAQRCRLVGAGVSSAWMGGDPASSLPCCGCLEPVYLAVVMRCGSGECYCLRCAATAPGFSPEGAVLLLARRLQRLEATAKWVEPQVCGGVLDAAWEDAGGLGPGGLTESARYGADPAADGALSGPYDWRDLPWPQQEWEGRDAGGEGARLEGSGEEQGGGSDEDAEEDPGEERPGGTQGGGQETTGGQLALHVQQQPQQQVQPPQHQVQVSMSTMGTEEHDSPSLGMLRGPWSHLITNGFIGGPGRSCFAIHDCGAAGAEEPRHHCHTECGPPFAGAATPDRVGLSIAWQESKEPPLVEGTQAKPGGHCGSDQIGGAARAAAVQAPAALECAEALPAPGGASAAADLPVAGAPAFQDADGSGRSVAGCDPIVSDDKAPLCVTMNMAAAQRAALPAAATRAASCQRCPQEGGPDFQGAAAADASLPMKGQEGVVPDQHQQRQQRRRRGVPVSAPGPVEALPKRATRRTWKMEAAEAERALKQRKTSRFATGC